MGGLNSNYYQILYKKANEDVWYSVDHLNENGSLPQIDVSATYQFKAKAGNAAGISEESSIITSHLYASGFNLFNQKTGFLGTDADTPNVSSSVGIVTHNKPVINLPKDLNGEFGIKIYISAVYWYKANQWFTSGNDDKRGSDILSIINTPLTVTKEQLRNNSMVELSNQFNTGEKSTAKSLKVQVINGTIKFYNVYGNDTDMNYCVWSSRNGTFAVLEKIEIL
ncbi:hypothetical protein DY123_07275 [Apilactobacillus micheneri]|nr:hypothetical protein DY123_07275 [Apilactobacillus micheneri]